VCKFGQGQCADTRISQTITLRLVSQGVAKIQP